MPAYEWSSKHGAWIKACCMKTCVRKIYIGGSGTEEETIEIFKRYFKFNQKHADGFSNMCRSCHLSTYIHPRDPCDREAMLQEQKGRCYLCNEEISFGTKSGACVDHNHKTGRVRKILCWWCNRDISSIEKRGGEWAQKATIYLLEHETR